MGENRRVRAAFLEAHPICCFCGGGTPSATVDHQPARALFDRREWPEGYEFPACSDCNQSSKHYENVLATLVRINPANEKNDLRREEVRKYMKSMGNNFPDLLRVLSTPEKRHFFKSEGISRNPNIPYQELHMVGIESELAQTSIDHVLKKLMRALHYKHTGQIVRSDAGLFLQWITNAYGHYGKDFEPFVNALGGRPVLKRNGRLLHDQFFYHYGTDHSAGDGFSAYAFFFRASFMAVGALSCDPKLLLSWEDEDQA